MRLPAAYFPSFCLSPKIKQNRNSAVRVRRKVGLLLHIVDTAPVPRAPPSPPPPKKKPADDDDDDDDHEGPGRGRGYGLPSRGQHTVESALRFHQGLQRGVHPLLPQLRTNEGGGKSPQERARAPHQREREHVFRVAVLSSDRATEAGITPTRHLLPVHPSRGLHANLSGLASWHRRLFDLFQRRVSAGGRRTGTLGRPLQEIWSPAGLEHQEEACGKADAGKLPCFRKHCVGGQCWPPERSPHFLFQGGELTPPPPKITRVAVVPDDAENKHEFKTAVKCFECGGVEVGSTAGKIPEVLAGVLSAMSARQQSDVKAWEEEIVGCAHTENLVQECKTKLDAQGEWSERYEYRPGYLLATKSVDIRLRNGTMRHMRLEGESMALPYLRKPWLRARTQGRAKLKRAWLNLLVVARMRHKRMRQELPLRVKPTLIGCVFQQLEHNMKFDFSMTTEDGKELQPLFGPGYTGLKNLGNRYARYVLTSVIRVRC
ncbi:MAG: hypothetical protein BJ554DRAFT_60 [Olpidium bornovanus]|uniref:Uncharacterized protein n=1 Tax=Olpidium bornovanus TaxID=278681 RepID=A0A8H7ZUQ7_9FUNG|nr:MAG: hypothetical protein BJ554DRAFT_60 [Olpidium bornovanus]